MSHATRAKGDGDGLGMRGVVVNFRGCESLEKIGSCWFVEVIEGKEGGREGKEKERNASR